MLTKERLVILVIGVATVVAVLYRAALAAQSKGTTKKATFDIHRFSPTPPGTFETFYVNDAQPLKEALDKGSVKEDTRLLVTETAAGKLALLTDQMAYHHIAQGTAGGKDWMVSF